VCGRPLRSPSCACAFSTLPEWCLAFAPRGYAGTTSGLRIETGTTQLWNSRRLAPTNDARPIRRVRVVNCSEKNCGSGSTRALAALVHSAPWDKTAAAAASAMAVAGSSVGASRPDGGAGASAVGGNTGGGFGRWRQYRRGVLWGKTRQWSSSRVGSAPAADPATYYICLSIYRSIVDRSIPLSIYLFVYLFV